MNRPVRSAFERGEEPPGQVPRTGQRRQGHGNQTGDAGNSPAFMTPTPALRITRVRNMWPARPGTRPGTAMRFHAGARSGPEPGKLRTARVDPGSGPPPPTSDRAAKNSGSICGQLRVRDRGHGHSLPRRRLQAQLRQRFRAWPQAWPAPGRSAPARRRSRRLSAGWPCAAPAGFVRDRCRQRAARTASPRAIGNAAKPKGHVAAWPS